MYVDPSLNTTTYQYDLGGEQTLEITPLGFTVTTQYDKNSNVTQTVDQDGRTTLMSYDGEGQLASKTWYNAGGSLEDVQTYTYDHAGNVLTAANYNGTYTLAYDTNGDVTSVSEPFGASLSFGYDLDGNRTCAGPNCDRISCQINAVWIPA